MTSNIQILAAVTGLFLSANVLARGGNDVRIDRPARGTAAWFAQESAEHLVEFLVATGKLTESALTSVSVKLESPTTSVVTIQSTLGTFEDTCAMTDHSSQSGSVLKKEVRCSSIPYYGARSDLTRGSNAWAVIEALEHTIRSEFALSSISANQLVAGTALLSATGQSVEVQLEFQGSVEKQYHCIKFMESSRHGTVIKPELACSAQ